MSIATANGHSIPLSGIGTIATPSLSLFDVYYISVLSMNLAFVRQIFYSRYDDCFSPSKCFVQDHTSQKVIEIGRRQGGLYVLNQFKESIVAASSVDLSSFRLSSSSPFYLWHSRLGHETTSRLKFLMSTRILGTLDNHDISALPSNKSISSSLAHFDLVHSYVWGSSPVSTKGGSRYYVSFINDFTRFT